MRSFRRAFTVAILLFSLFSCSDMEDMIEDYNSDFSSSGATVVTDLEGPQPDDPDFNKDDMLYSEYFVYDDGTLTLAAPSRCLTYEWVLTDPVTEEVIDVTTLDGTLLERYFRIYVPNSGLESDKTYKLTLTVMGYKGGVYTDSCGLIIYKHYDHIYWTPEYD